MSMARWERHVAAWQDCTRCPLWQTRTKVVLCRGSIPADIAFVGEAPGDSEDLVGNPFVGPAGRLLNGMIRDALAKLGHEQELPTREQPDPLPNSPWRMLFSNLVGCMPEKRTDDHRPKKESILKCRPRLLDLIDMAQPRLIIAVGTTARDELDPKIHNPVPFTKWIPSASITHPAAMLRAPTAQGSLMRKQAVLALIRAFEEHLINAEVVAPTE